MTPDDEAWEAFYVNPDAVTFTRAEARVAFLAGRVSGRADAAAQALEDAADAWVGGEWHDVNFNKARRDENPGQRQARWLRARAAQYREKGKADA